jgi:hypothetical protein
VQADEYDHVRTNVKAMQKLKAHGRHEIKENAMWESCDGAGDANSSSFMQGKPSLR